MSQEKGTHHSIPNWHPLYQKEKKTIKSLRLMFLLGSMRRCSTLSAVSQVRIIVRFCKTPPKRGPPKQYIELLEARLQLVERALRTIDGPARQILDTLSHLIPHSCRKEMERSPRGSIGIPAISIVSRSMKLDRPCTWGTAKRESIESLVSSSLLCRCLPTSTPTSTTPMSFTSRARVINAYFEHVHKYCPMIYKPLFRKQMKSKTDRPSRLLLYAMCAVASRWILTPSVEQASRAGHIAALPPGFSYYRRAFALLGQHTGTPSIPTIQALVLLTKYQEYYARVGFFRRQTFFLCMAVRMCVDLGLPQLDAASVEDPYEAETRKRTFWMTFLYDLMTR